MPKTSLSQQFLKALDDTFSKEDAMKFFQDLTEAIKGMVAKLDAKMAQHSQEMQERHDEHMSEMEKKSMVMDTKVKQTEEMMRSEARTLMRLIDQKVKYLEDEMPEEYDDVALRQEIEAVRGAIPEMPEKFDPSDIVEDIEEHEQKIERLEKELEDLKRRPVGRGGGTSAMGVAQAFKYILKTESPSGAINGSNTAYTVQHPIAAVLSFSLNGETIAQLPNYTIAGRTITFASALPSVYSGKDFEIKYISL